MVSQTGVHEKAVYKLIINESQKYETLGNPYITLIIMKT